VKLELSPRSRALPISIGCFAPSGCLQTARLNKSVSVAGFSSLVSLSVPFFDSSRARCQLSLNENTAAASSASLKSPAISFCILLARYAPKA